MITKEQEQELFRRYQVDGDEEAREKLIVEFMPHVIKMSNRKDDYCDYVDVDDVISEGYIILMKCVDDFKPLLGYRFSTYLCKSLAWNTHNVDNKEINYNKRYRCGDIDNYDKACTIYIGDIIDRAALITAVHELLEKNPANLTPTEVTVIRRRFGLSGDKPETFTSLAKEIKRSPERVRQINIEALRKLRSYLDEAGSITNIIES